MPGAGTNDCHGTSKHTVAPKLQNTFITQQALKSIDDPAVEQKFLTRHTCSPTPAPRGGVGAGRLFPKECHSNITVRIQGHCVFWWLWLLLSIMLSLTLSRSLSILGQLHRLFLWLSSLLRRAAPETWLPESSVRWSNPAISILVEPHAHRTHTT